MEHEPQTLQEAIVHFSDPDVALKTMVDLRWPAGVKCPTCGRSDVRFISTRRMWECKEKHPKRQFTAKVGTIFEDSPLGLDKWFAAIWLIANCKNGISSYEIHRGLGVTQKTGWFMLHRIRLAMKTGTFLKLEGTIEADETYIGGIAKNMHKGRREAVVKGRGRKTNTKSAVLGILRRKDQKGGSKVKAVHMRDLSGPSIKQEIRDAVEKGSNLYTDYFGAYRGLGPSEYHHFIIDHSYEYVRGAVHVNTLENFWSLLKRTVKGTYVSVEPFHLGRYLDEQSFRYNEREGVDADRFRAVLSSVAGRRLTYKELIGHDAKTTTKE